MPKRSQTVSEILKRHHKPPEDTTNNQPVFEKEKKTLHAQLTQSQSRHKKKFEIINLNKLGELHRKAKKFEEAIDYYQQVFKIDKEDNYMLGGMGLTYHDMGDYDNAIVWFKRQLNPIKTLTNLSRAYCHKGDYQQAIDYAKHALEKDAKDQIAIDNLAIAYRKKGDYQQAIVWYQKILELDSRNKQAMDGLGITYREMGEYEQAIVWYQKKLELDSRNKQAMDGLGITYREMGEYEQAIVWFQKKLELDSRNKQAMDGLGITYREMGEYEQAIVWFQKKLDLYPRDKQAMAGLGITYQEMGDYEKSIQWFQKKLSDYPNDKLALHGLQTTYKKMGATPKAVDCLKNRLRTEPTDSAAHAELTKIGEKYETEEQWKEAKEILGFLKDNQEPAVLTISSQKSETETIEEKIERLEKKMKEKDAMVLRSQQMATIGMMATGIAHEIRQPLQIILNKTVLCQRDLRKAGIDNSNPIFAKLESIANVTTERIDKMVQHLYRLSREPKPPSETEPVDVNNVIEEALSGLQQQLKSRGILFNKHFADNLPPIQADEVQIEQVIINLITNARDALEGRDNPEITIATQQNKEAVQIKFTDNGEGISPKDLEQIFDPFFTGKESSGLGLHIAKDIVESYHGTIAVESIINEGTNFLIQFPIPILS